MRRLLFRAVATSVAAVVVSTTWGAGAAFADPAGSTPVILAVNDLPTVIDNLTKAITAILATIATLFLTIGGARYLMAGGDPSEVERAKGALKSAGIGYALALLAPILLIMLNKALGV